MSPLHVQNPIVPKKLVATPLLIGSAQSGHLDLYCISNYTLLAHTINYTLDGNSGPSAVVTYVLVL